MFTYNVVINGVAGTAAQDLWEIRPATNRPVRIKNIQISQSSDVGDAAEEMLPITIIRGNTTSGSGGSSPTPVPLDPSAPAAAFAAEINNTTQASGGSPVTLWSGAFNIRTGELLMFPPDLYIKARASDTILVVRLPNAPADSLTFHGVLTIEED